MLTPETLKRCSQSTNFSKPSGSSSNFFNKNTKCYYYKKINKKDLPNILRNDIKINANGESQLYNERGKFISSGVITPIYLLLIIWPLFYIIPNNLVTWCFFNSIIIFLYNVIFVFLRFRIDLAYDAIVYGEGPTYNSYKELIDENYPYYISYTIFSLKYNIVNVLNIN